MSRHPYEAMSDPAQNYLFSRPWSDDGAPCNALADHTQELRNRRLAAMRRKAVERQTPNHEE